MLDTEEKLSWCEKYGADNELAFAVGRMHSVGLPTFLNPDKRDNKFTHDLCTIFPTDLKSVRTPLYKARELFDIDPQYAVTFNVKDGVRYQERYPNIIVIFDVEWSDVCTKTIGGVVYEVQPMHQIHAGFLSDIKAAIKMGKNKKLEYSKRQDDQSGNAKDSYVFDIRHLQRLT